MSVKRLVPLHTVELSSDPAVENSRRGEIYYNTVNDELRYFDGTIWQAIGTGVSLDTEAVQDIVGAMVSNNTETDLVIEYNDTDGKLNFSIGPNVVTTTSLGNTLTDPVTGYVPIGDVANPDGVASLDSSGYVPDEQLNINERIQDVAAKLITDGTHTNISVTYDDENATLNLVGSSGGGGANVSISSSAPTSPSSGDLWLDSDTAILYAFEGSFWVEISGSGGSSGGGSGNFTLSTTAPVSPSEGDTWFNTESAKLYVYYDSYWVEAIASGATGPQGDTGPAGADGADGAQGPAGADGADGASAYQVAVNNGFIGTEQQWLDSLVGPAGADGADGAQGSQGDPGPAGADGSPLIPLEVSSNITMQAQHRYFVNTSAIRTLTLPATPALNDEIQILDASGTASTYNITVARNANKINGGTGNLIIDMNGAWVTLLYTGSTYGWKVA